MVRETRRKEYCASIILAGLTVVGIAAAAVQPAAGPQTAVQSSRQVGSKSNSGGVVTQEEFLQRVNLAFGLTSSSVIQLQVDPTPDLPIQAEVLIAGNQYTMELLPHSIRAPGYRLMAQIEDGSIVDVPPGPSRMLRGSLLNLPNSQAAGGLLEDGLHVGIRMPDGQRWWIEPLAGRVAGAGPDQYVLYRSEDVVHPNGTCGVNDAAFPAEPLPPGFAGGSGTDGAAVYCTELACDADFEYYQRYGSNVTSVQNRINLVINTMDLQYINQVDIDHIITGIVVRTAEPDPYTSTNANTLLNQFRSEWLSNQAGIPRDVAQLFTAKEIDGTTIGIAFTIGGICTSSAYCLVQSDCCGGLSCSTDLSAHELGHLWGASHCTSSCSSTMNPSITCANTFTGSNPDSVASIIAHRNTRSCLSACADATLPFFDNFPTTTFDPAKWTTVSGAIIDTVGISEPSAPNSMRLRGTSSGGAQVRTSRINTAGLASLTLSYYYERKGGGDQPENNDDLIVEYFNSSGAWTEISRQLGNGPAMTTYSQATVNFPPDAMHSEFRLRFRVSSSQNNLDDWFVDDVSITGIAMPENDLCINATLIAEPGSYAFTTLGSSTDGPTDPSLCTFNGNSQITNDVWYKVLAPCTGNLTLSVCGSNFNTKMAVYTSCPSASDQAIACNDDFCGTSSQLTFAAVQSQVYRLRIGGFNGASGSGVLNVSCVSTVPPCPADITHDSQVNVSDLLAVINAWGACAGCAADINSDNQVNVSDLLAVINGWGACPQ